MGLDDFRIVFDNPWSTYYPGQTVTGRVIVGLNSAKKIRGKFFFSAKINDNELIVRIILVHASMKNDGRTLHTNKIFVRPVR